MEKTTCIQMDHENSSEEFYDFGLDTKNEVPSEIRSIILDGNEVMVTPGRAKEIEAWCVDAPGYYSDDSPEFSPHPILFHENY